MKQLLMGNEAIGLAAIHAGVNVVCGYPGTPSTEVLETVAKHNDGSIHVQWSDNEKVALEVGAGAAYAGARVLVTMKQVGLNVAGDPLMCLAYMGVKGGMVVLVADDPGPISSQTEQDTRRYGSYSKVPVLDPSTPQEACDMVAQAFALSEQLQIPVILRPTTRICHACAAVELRGEPVVHRPEGFVKDSRWVIFPRLSYQNHLRLFQTEQQLAQAFSDSPFNSITGEGKLGVVASGVSYAYLCEVLAERPYPVRVLKVGTPYPFPAALARRFLKGLERVLVLEELDAVLEDALYQLCGEQGVEILGRRSGFTKVAGENTVELIRGWLAALTGVPAPAEQPPVSLPQMPQRPPVLCAGCPHRASFYAVKQAMKGQKAVFSGDIGCYTLGNAAPLDMVDTCLCMGACITVAQGIHLVEPDTKNFAFIGDSTFFHSGIPGILNAVYNQTDITVIVLDNSTTAMTGHQPHPGTGRTMMGQMAPHIDIEAILRACGVQHVATADPLQQEEAVRTVRQAAEVPGVSAVIFRSPCIALYRPVQVMEVDTRCLGCKKCIREIGCPALAVREGAVQVDPTLCTGCGLCAQLCPTGALQPKPLQ